jgi:hypothetical protein
MSVLILGSIAFITKTIPSTPLHIAQVVGNVQDQQIAHVAEESGDWLTYGRNYGEERFSPLGQITKQNVSQLGLAWSLNLGTTRGIEGTPLVVDGIMFLSGPWSIVYAINTRTGKLLWTYDPQSGGFPAEDLESIMGQQILMPSGESRASGMLASHYAPQCKVILVDTYAEATSALVEIENARVLEHSENYPLYAASLYSQMRQADLDKIAVIIAVLPLNTGLGSAIRDRLNKASFL